MVISIFITQYTSSTSEISYYQAAEPNTLPCHALYSLGYTKLQKSFHSVLYN